MTWRRALSLSSSRFPPAARRGSTRSPAGCALCLPGIIALPVDRARTRSPEALPAMATLLNAPDGFVDEMLGGLCEAHAGLSRLAEHDVIVRTPCNSAAPPRVALLSGGGSGHEPAHAGYVGVGMLSAAVCGGVFASPSVAAVLAGIRAVASPAGVLVIVKNYTGDRINFGLAAERAKAEGIAVEVVVVGDDCALPPAGIAGRRGLAGVVLVHKVAGAAAEAGLPLAAVAAEARAVAAAVGTMGVAFSVATLPGQAQASRQLAAGMCELGLGIHGEPGAETVPLPRADALAARLLERIQRSGYVHFPAGGDVVLVVNSLGATPGGELAIMCRAATACLRAAGMCVARLYCGAFMTSLDAAGVSLSLLRVDDARLLARLDAATDAPAWPHHAGKPGERAPARLPAPSGPSGLVAQAQEVCAAATTNGAALRAAICAGAHALQALEAQLGAWDAAVGDGDCGTTLAKGAAAVLQDECCYAVDDPAAAAAGLAASVRRSMGGTSGVLYDILFSAAEASLRAPASAAAAWPVRLAAALRAGVDAVARCGGADRGMRTMLDALLPAADAASLALAADADDGAAALDAAAAAAELGADATVNMPALAGRSSYVPAAVLRATPDPGAKAAAAWLRAAARSVRAGATAA
jgi:dihydroxyacetone kinase